MGWDSDLVIMTRVLVNDLAVPQKYGDEELQKVLVCAAILVGKEIGFPNQYNLDIVTPAITPDPLTLQDSLFIALVPLKAACILNQGAYMTAIGQGIKVRDGDSAIDTSVGFAGWRDILKLGPCASYQKLSWQVQTAGVVGDAVLGAYRGATDNYLDTISFFYDDFAQALAPLPRRWR